MLRRIVTVSFTGIDAPGGVPRFNRELRDAFPDREVVHFCWDDAWRNCGAPIDAIGQRDIPEWEKAKILNRWLLNGHRVTSDDIIIADGFWLDGLDHLPHTISVAHGIWSHLIKEEADADVPPDMPWHHTAQVSFRRRYLRRGGRIVAVSRFIQHEMERQWGFESTVINNGMNPGPGRSPIPHLGNRCVHGVNDKTNGNKGWEHVQAVKRMHVPGLEIASLDQWARALDKTKDETFRHIDFALIPSGFEGNSYFALECMANDVPMVTYSVGLPFQAWERGESKEIGVVMDRTERSIERTIAGVEQFLDGDFEGTARDWLEENASLDLFRQNWRRYVEERFP